MTVAATGTSHLQTKWIACGTVTGLVATLTAISGLNAVHVAVLAIWAAPVTAAAIEDASTARLRDAVVLRGATVVAAVAVIAAVVDRDAHMITGPLVASAAFGGWLLFTHLLAPTGMGWGDVKFAVLLGMGIGIVTPAAVVLAGVLAIVLQIIVTGVRPLPAQRNHTVRRHEAPFGPSLALASIVVICALVMLRQGGGA